MHVDHERDQWDAWAETVDARLGWLHQVLEETNNKTTHNATVVQYGFVLLKEQTKTHQTELQKHLEQQLTQAFEQIQTAASQRERSAQDHRTTM